MKEQKTTKKEEGTEISFPEKLCDSCLNCDPNGDCRFCRCPQNPGDFCDGYQAREIGPSEAQQEAAAADEAMGPGYGYSAPCHRMSFETFCSLPGNRTPRPRRQSERVAAARLPKTPKTTNRFVVWMKVSTTSYYSWRVLLETNDLNSAYLAFMNCLYETRLYDTHKKVNLLVEAL